mmetsp:Transcript_42827/g.118367  ORF Transcript_42827/g.118367 Transcript_42827/m.118367 type:complete len:221 (+) Transcript_42827:604-1266(+)
MCAILPRTVLRRGLLHLSGDQRLLADEADDCQRLHNAVRETGRRRTQVSDLVAEGHRLSLHPKARLLRFAAHVAATGGELLRRRFKAVSARVQRSGHLVAPVGGHGDHLCEFLLCRLFTQLFPKGAGLLCEALAAVREQCPKVVHIVLELAPKSVTRLHQELVDLGVSRLRLLALCFQLAAERRLEIPILFPESSDASVQAAEIGVCRVHSAVDGVCQRL